MHLEVLEPVSASRTLSSAIKNKQISGISNVIRRDDELIVPLQKGADLDSIKASIYQLPGFTTLINFDMIVVVEIEEKKRYDGPDRIYDTIDGFSVVGLDFENAEALALEMLKDFENQPEQEDRYLETMLALSEIYRNEYRYEAAVATLSQALADYLKMTKPIDAGGLAYRLLELERLKDVDDLIRHAYAMQKKGQRGSHSSVGGALNRLIEAYTQKKMVRKANSLRAIARSQDTKNS